MKTLMCLCLTFSLLSCATPEGRERNTKSDSNDDTQLVMSRGPEGSLLVHEDAHMPPNFSALPLYVSHYVSPKGETISLPVDQQKLSDGVIFKWKNQIHAILVDKHRTAWLWSPGSPKKKKKIMEKVAAGFDVHEGTGRMALMVGEMPTYHLFLFDLTSWTSKKLTVKPTSSWNPTFSPNGEEVALVYSPLGFPAIYTIELSTGALRQRTSLGLTAREALRDASRIDPFPEGPKSMVWLNKTLFFSRKIQSERVIFSLHTKTGKLTRTTHKGELRRTPRGPLLKTGLRFTKITAQTLQKEVTP